MRSKHIIYICDLRFYFFVILFSLNYVVQATAENIYICLYCAYSVNCLLNTPVMRAFQLFYYSAYIFNKCTKVLSDFNQFSSLFQVHFLLRMHFEGDNSFKLLKTPLKL